MIVKKKSKSGLLKRFNRTKTGKVSYFSVGKRHNLTSRSPKSLRFSGHKVFLRNKKEKVRIFSLV